VRKKRKKILKFLIQDLLDVAVFQLVKGDFPQRIFAYIFRTELWKNNGILFKKLVNIACLSYPKNLFRNPIITFTIPPFNTTISTFKCKNTSHFCLLWTSDIWVVLILIFIFYILPYNILAHSSHFCCWDLSRRGGRGGTWWWKVGRSKRGGKQ